ncbi:MAG: hypothetical protein KME50_13190, partial [Nostoc desertorum CM1-VF14]|nr:hypothetical protein [Nostoc desertorum CM1-VF14]
SKLTRTPDVSTTAPPSLGEQPTLTRQSFNQEQKIAPNSATVVPTSETLTPVAQSNLPNYLTTQTQTTLPTQPNLDSTSTETSAQNASVLPTVTNSYVSDQSKPARTADVSTTAPPSLGEQPTLTRQSLNQEQKIAPNSATVVPTPETLTPVAQSNLPNHLTAQTQLNLDSTSTETSVQNSSILPTPIPGASTTISSTLRDESTVVQQGPIGDFLNESSPKNPSFDNLPAPTGFATGGQVATTQFQGSQSIAPSDTVSAMLTPGEFVINAQNTQKNLNLLEHINSGGRPETFISPKEIPNSQDERKSALASNHSTHADSSNESLIQRGSLDATLPTTSHTLISSSIGQEIFGKQSFSRPTFIQAYRKENTITKVGKQSEQYSLPNLIFQQPTFASNSPSETAPSQWSSVEELLGGSTNQPTVFDSKPVKSNRGNSKLSTGSKSSKTAIRRKSVFQGFANEKEVTALNEVTSSNKTLPSDIDTEAQPITETMKNFCCSPPTEDKIADEIETLAREIYNRLRQRLEVERERHGNSMYSGRLPW